MNDYFSNFGISHPEAYELQNIFNREELFTEIPEKTNEKGVQTLLGKFIEIARGSIKIVWVKRSKIVPSGKDGLSQEVQSKSVYYTAINSFFGGALRELRSEFEKMKAIVSKLGGLSNCTHLAVEAKEVDSEEQIKGEYTIEVEEASTNFEKKMRDPRTPWVERVQFGSNFLKGLSNLHLADYAHGDMKPENCLIYEKERGNLLKLSDFGKTKELKDGETAIYSGNMRYAPPEGVQSKKGDVYSAALILIRNFEEEFLKYNLNPSSSLVKIEDKDIDIVASPDLRGVEKYVVENKNFLACNEGFDFDTFKRRIIMGIPSATDMENQTTAIHHYIDALQEKLKDDQDKRLPMDKIEALCDLLKNMTIADPLKRISAAKAAEHYEQIFRQL